MTMARRRKSSSRPQQPPVQAAADGEQEQQQHQTGHVPTADVIVVAGENSSNIDLPEPQPQPVALLDGDGDGDGAGGSSAPASSSSSKCPAPAADAEDVVVAATTAKKDEAISVDQSDDIKQQLDNQNNNTKMKSSGEAAAAAAAPPMVHQPAPPQRLPHPPPSAAAAAAAPPQPVLLLPHHHPIGTADAVSSTAAAGTAFPAHTTLPPYPKYPILVLVQPLPPPPQPQHQHQQKSQQQSNQKQPPPPAPVLVPYWPHYPPTRLPPPPLTSAPAAPSGATAARGGIVPYPPNHTLHRLPFPPPPPPYYHHPAQNTASPFVLPSPFHLLLPPLNPTSNGNNNNNNNILPVYKYTTTHQSKSWKEMINMFQEFVKKYGHGNVFGKGGIGGFGEGIMGVGFGGFSVSSVGGGGGGGGGGGKVLSTEKKDRNATTKNEEAEKEGKPSNEVTSTEEKEDNDGGGLGNKKQKVSSEAMNKVEGGDNNEMDVKKKTTKEEHVVVVPGEKNDETKIMVAVDESEKSRAESNNKDDDGKNDVEMREEGNGKEEKEIGNKDDDEEMAEAEADDDEDERKLTLQSWIREVRWVIRAEGLDYQEDTKGRMMVEGQEQEEEQQEQQQEEQEQQHPRCDSENVTEERLAQLKSLPHFPLFNTSVVATSGNVDGDDEDGGASDSGGDGKINKNMSSSNRNHPQQPRPAFQQWLDDLMHYRAKHDGDCNVPVKYPEYPGLGNFVNRQRSEYRKFIQGKSSSMTETKIRLLDRVNFIWLVRKFRAGIGGGGGGGRAGSGGGGGGGGGGKVTWERRLLDLQAYHRMHGHTNVPKHYSPNPSLGDWVIDQRFQYKRQRQGKSSYMTPYKIEKLNALNFQWSLREGKRPWEEWMDQLRKYKEEHGHVNVSSKYEPNMALGSFVNNQRTRYRVYQSAKSKGIGGGRGSGGMTEEKIRELEELGFVWNIREGYTPWSARLEELRAYRRRYGNCNVPENWPENPALSKWVIEQRRLYTLYGQGGGQKCQLTAERAKQLKDLDF